MRIAVVGGFDKQARSLADFARANGHRLESHTGVLRGPVATASLRALVERSDLVVIVTDLNSHNAVAAARRHARRARRTVRLTRRFGPTDLAALLRSPTPAS